MRERTDPGRDTGDDLERDACISQCEGLLSPASEHERISALQAHHDFVVGRQLDQ